MKKVKVLTFVALALVLLAACAPAATPEPKVVEKEVVVTVEVGKEGPVTIGYAAPSLVGGQINIQESLIKNAKTKGWAVVTTNANGDPQRQNDDIDYFISLGVDAIVTVPQDSAGICAAVEKAKEAGIPFYTIDRSPSGCQINMTVLSDNRLAGQQAGQAMVDLLTKKYGEPKGKVLEITGDLGQNVGQLRRDGFHDILDKYPHIEVIQKVGDGQADVGAQIVEDGLGANPDLDGIYMHSDAVYMAGTMAVLDQAGKLFKRGEEGHIFLTAVDGSPAGVQAIKDGWADESSNQPVPDFGIVVNWIEQELNGQPVEESTVEKAGALWSPARIKINEDGTPELFLSTTAVTEENQDDPGLWANQ